MLPGRERQPERIRAWNREQVQTFLTAHTDDRLIGLYSVAVYTGLRRGELLALRWEDVDLDAGTIAVRRNLVRAGSEVHEGTPKTKNSNRTIHVGAWCALVLREHRKRQAAERLAFSGVYEDQGRVFAREDGRHLDPDAVSKRFARLLRPMDLPRITFHELRHTAATVSLAAGMSVQVVSKRLGHASIAITLDVYGHLLRDEDEAAAALLDAYMS